MAMFKAFLLPNYISEQSNFSGMLVTLLNFEKISLSTLWLSKIKGHGHPKLTILALAVNFQTSPRFCFLVFFTRIWRIVADKIIFDLRKFYCKIWKGLWDVLGQTWDEM